MASAHLSLRPVEAGPITFSVPADFDDLTAYVFRDRTGTGQFTVHAAFGGSPPDRAAAAYLTGLGRLVGPAGVRFERVWATGTADQPGLGLELLFRDQGRLKLERRAFGALTDGATFSVSLVTQADASSIVPEFSAILASVGPATALEQPPIAGCTRYQVGAITLDVPEGYRPPECYQFASEDAKVRLNVRLTSPDDPPPLAFQGTPELERVYNASVAPAPPYGGAEMFRLDKGEAAEPQYMCRQSRKLPGMVAYLTGQCASSASTGRMEAAFAALAGSLRSRV